MITDKFEELKRDLKEQASLIRKLTLEVDNKSKRATNPKSAGNSEIKNLELKLQKAENQIKVQETRLNSLSTSLSKANLDTIKATERVKEDMKNVKLQFEIERKQWQNKEKKFQEDLKKEKEAAQDCPCSRNSKNEVEKEKHIMAQNKQYILGRIDDFKKEISQLFGDNVGCDCEIDGKMRLFVDRKIEEFGKRQNEAIRKFCQNLVDNVSEM